MTGLRIEPPSLEELFLRHYGDVVAEAVDDTASNTVDARGKLRR